MNETSFSQLREKCGLTLKQVSESTGYSLRTVYRWENNEARLEPDVMDWLKNFTKRLFESETIEPRFAFADLFAGIGGMRKAFEDIGGKCVFTSEWNKFSRLTYCANFAVDHAIAGDITQIPEETVPAHDVLLAGFPCQPFSIAGVSKKNALGRPHGFECKTQGTLFFDVARIISYHRPKAFLLENVKNLQRHDKGKTFQIITETLDELGYYYDWKVIDAKPWVPQHRERIFIVGFRNDCGFGFDDFAAPDASTDYFPTLETVLHPEDGTEKPEDPYTKGPDARVSDKYTLSDHLWQYLQNYAKKHQARGNGFGFGLVGPNDVARTLSARYYKDGSEILIRQKNCNPRRLTPRECARLMGFDKPGETAFKIPVSDTQAYQQFGNAVVVDVVRAVARHMKPYLSGYTRRRIKQASLFDKSVNQTVSVRSHG
jgi:DNA (cytosine-5)-methyltransferase 1